MRSLSDAAVEAWLAEDDSTTTVSVVQDISTSELHVAPSAVLCAEMGGPGRIGDSGLGFQKGTFGVRRERWRDVSSLERQSGIC